MHIPTVLLALLAATITTAKRLESADVPAACTAQCTPTMNATQTCDAQLVAQFGGPRRFRGGPGPRLARRQTGVPVAAPLPAGSDARAARRQAEAACVCPAIRDTGAQCQSCIRANGWTGPKMDDIMGMCIGV
ncbi:hypothetical protein P8C59_007721 [Phyllachora maydis]|uniref:Uncharacterized protein n=1 Tax=Phyllachora maydis TaxID=1825666 RepID=A0AAD9I9A9_9PEZI|nr:hypothetical protein P8C59_007721 [Phyllachora maydis]